MRKLSASDWPKTIVFFTYYECKIVGVVQITNSARVSPKFRPFWLSVKLYSCKLLTSNNMISCAIWWSTCKLYKFYKPYGLVQFFRLYKNLLVPITLNCSRNHVLTYTNYLAIMNGGFKDTTKTEAHCKSC